MIANHDSTQQTVRFHIKRQDTPDSAPYWAEYDVPFTPGASMNITSVLQWIASHPTTAEGDNQPPVAYEVACLEEVCGSCSMLVNGQVRQACSTLVDDLLEEGQTITLEPMSKFPVVRDLTVDRQRMFETLKKIRGWVPIDSTFHRGSGPRETPEQQDTRYALSRCMTCGCCLEACPQFTLDNDFIGAAAISQTRYFNGHPTGQRLKDDRLDVMMGPGGVVDCGNAQNCVKVCPKDIPLTESIADVGGQTTRHAIKKFFTSRD